MSAFPQSIESWRAVEVISAPHYGSGYRIGGRLVLTAKHLVAGKSDDRCTVRARHAFGECRADVLWTAPDADVALVALPEDVEDCPPTRLGSLPSEPNAAIIEFEVYGWPKWAWTTRPQETAKAGGRHIVGKIYLADTSPDGLLVVEPERGPEAPEPDEVGSEWAGISGAAVICNGLVVAVQHHHQNPLRAASLEATPLSKVYDDPEWSRFLRDHGVPTEPQTVSIASSARIADQPVLTLNLLEPNDANRLTYRARRVPLVGRQEKLAALNGFLADAAPVSWLVVSGPGGSGKSRLAQEFCLAAGPQWRAGFLAPQQEFDWAAWQPHIHTLIAVDYAAERVDEIHALLSGLLARPERDTRIRVLLIEREADGPWMQELVGKRSEGYALEQARCADSPLVLGALSEGALWEIVLNVLRRGGRPLPSKTQVLKRLSEIDPEGRPLFAAFVSDALLAGRDLRQWDRDRLLRDVLERERLRWTAENVPESYENLLALATVVGGDTEQILGAPVIGLELPDFREFDRRYYNVMTGCSLEGDVLPALKPDLLGEFFVLEHARGRNDKVTALQADELAAAAWRIRGGSKENDPIGDFGIKYISASSLVLFLSQIVEDFPDHPATRNLLKKPTVTGADLRYWATLVSVGIRQYATVGNLDAARALFDELSAMSLEDLRQIDGVGGFIRSGLYFLPVLAREKRHKEALEILERVWDTVSQSTPGTLDSMAFCEAGAEAAMFLLVQGERGLVETLVEKEAELVRADPEAQNLRLAYARTLAACVRSEEELSWREQIYKRLSEYCRSHEDDVPLYEPLARAAWVLCAEYARNPDRLGDAETKNRTIRGLERLRSQQRLYRFKEPFSWEYEWIEDDLRSIRLCLADSDTELIGPWTRAERFEEASQMLDEVERLSRPYGQDVEFARMWAHAVMMHADARAIQGATDQVTKAVNALKDLAARYSGNTEFILKGSMLARIAANRAANNGDLAIASEMLGLVEHAARLDGAPPELVADYAEAAMGIYRAHEKTRQWDECVSVGGRAAWAIRSEAYLERLRTRGLDQTGEKELLRWVQSLESTKT